MASSHLKALYLLGGAGTRRMNQLKFMGRFGDDSNLDMIYSIEGAEKVAAMGFNCVFLAYHWGFPPEIERDDWIAFQSAVEHYHRVGVKVFGYIQASNCVYSGSYTDKDWYALDSYGGKIYYYTGRYLTSLSHSGWVGEIRDRVRSLVETGADGIFFDNIWAAGVGVDISEMPMGIIGSYDEYSRRAYAAAFNGAEIPLVLDTQIPQTQQYLRWRASLLSTVLRDWVQTARDLNPNIMIAANNIDIVARNSYVAFGIDIEQLTDIQDLIVVQNYALPRVLENKTVIANAITIGAVASRSKGKPAYTAPARDGVGYETMWSPLQIKRALLEALAMNMPLLVKGTGFLYHHTFTSLLHRRYEQHTDELRQLAVWTDEHTEWLEKRQNYSPLAIYYPYRALHWSWNRIAPYFFAACQVLLQHGYPLRIVGDDDSWDGIQTLIVPPGHVDGLDEKLSRFVEAGGRVVPLVQARDASQMSPLWKGWYPFKYRIPRWRWLRRRLNRGAALSWRLYHRYRFGRWIGGWLKVNRALTQSPLHFVPADYLQKVLLDAIRDETCPRVESETPILLTVWIEADGTRQWHLVNYSDEAQRVTLYLGDLTGAWIYTPGQSDPPSKVVGSAILLNIEIAKILRAPRQEQGEIVSEGLGDV